MNTTPIKESPNINYASPLRCFFGDWCYWPGCNCERKEGPVSVVLPWYCFDVEVT
jgi:hypothetical protein